MRPKFAAVLVAIAMMALSGCAPASTELDVAPEASVESVSDQTSLPDPTDSPEAAAEVAPSFAVTTPVAIEEFDHHMRLYPRDPEAVGGNAASVCAEYEAAAAGFPIPLPDGYAFPLPLPLTLTEWPDFTLTCDLDSDMSFERGIGLSMAFSFWSAATATAALADFDRGDEVAAMAHLDALDAAHTEAVISLYVTQDEPLGPHPAATAARVGDLSVLQAEAGWFLGTAEYADMAAAAGDLTN